MSQAAAGEPSGDDYKGKGLPLTPTLSPTVKPLEEREPGAPGARPSASAKRETPNAKRQTPAKCENAKRTAKRQSHPQSQARRRPKALKKPHSSPIANESKGNEPTPSERT